MKLALHKMTTMQGVPVYIERYPGVVTPVSVVLCMMSGGADDSEVGVRGVHHWGEHLPFRGTVSYPNGAPQIMGRFSELGGHVGAYTSQLNTVYSVKAPKSNWLDALEMVVELAGRPLNRPEDIEAERQIIGEEIKSRNSDRGIRAGDYIQTVLWGDHPLGQNVIGTLETLAATDLQAIDRMHEASYGLERCSLFVAGDVDPDEVTKQASVLLERMPSRNISVRRSPAFYPGLPEWKGGLSDMTESEFDSSTVGLVFPKPARVMNSQTGFIYSQLDRLFSAGSLASPLYRIVRGERQLAYAVAISTPPTVDMGFFALTAMTSRAKVDDVIQAFWDVIALPELRSKERWELLRRTMLAQHNMRLPDPTYGTQRMLGAVMRLVDVDTDDDQFERAMSISHESVLAALDTLTEAAGRVVVFQGK